MRIISVMRNINSDQRKKGNYDVGEIRARGSGDRIRRSNLRIVVASSCE